MTFYQELQLNQAGSKKVIRESETAQEKWRHILIYLLKIAITVGFCFVFVTLYSLIFGAGNSIVGVVVLLHLLVFKNADLRIDAKQSAGLLALFFGIMTVAPHLANLANPFVGLLIHAAAISILILFGCHEPRMFNQSTLVLSYLLLYGYDVSGTEYLSRLAGMAVGALLVCAVFYKNHRHQTYDLRAQDILPAFTLTHMRSKWQLCQILCVPLVLFLSELFGLPRAMWAGIAAMSAILPVMDDMHARVRGRILGNIAGVLCFLFCTPICRLRFTHTSVSLAASASVSPQNTAGRQFLTPSAPLRLHPNYMVCPPPWVCASFKTYSACCSPWASA